MSLKSSVMNTLLTNSCQIQEKIAALQNVAKVPENTVALEMMAMIYNEAGEEQTLM